MTFKWCLSEVCQRLLIRPSTGPESVCRGVSRYVPAVQGVGFPALFHPLLGPFNFLRLIFNARYVIRGFFFSLSSTGHAPGMRSCLLSRSVLTCVSANTSGMNYNFNLAFSLKNEFHLRHEKEQSASLHAWHRTNRRTSRLV